MAPVRVAAALAGAALVVAALVVAATATATTAVAATAAAARATAAWRSTDRDRLANPRRDELALKDLLRTGALIELPQRPVLG
jgi:L-alanine-DL-glutamate epimerase-like enolase superfamily enzyme